MKLKDIHAKLLNGETLSDEETAYIREYDEQKLLNAAAAKARKDAEEAARVAKADADAAKNAATAETLKVQDLLKRMEGLEKTLADRDAQILANKRDAAIAKAFADAGVKPAHGVSPELFARCVKLSTEKLAFSLDRQGKGTFADANAVKAAIEAFRNENKGLVADAGLPGTGNSGAVPSVAPAGKNPFAKETFNLTEQAMLWKTDRAQALRLATEAGADIGTGGAATTLTPLA